MKSKLQDRDELTYRNGEKRILKKGELMSNGVRYNHIECYTESLTDRDGESWIDIIRVTRDGVIIWERSEPINKMMTVEVNGENYPLPTRENMKVLVDKISELELRIKSLENANL